jgi:hypothetical protein
MGKLRQWFRKVFDRWVEQSFQRQADKIFAKNKVKYTDGDNT